MKKLVFIALGLWLTLGIGCRPGAPSSTMDPALAAKLHFVGMAYLGPNTNAIKLREVAQLPATQPILDRIQKHFSLSLSSLAIPAGKGKASEAAPLIKPLWADFWNAESFVEIYGDSKQIGEWMIALRLDPSRAALWNTNCWKAMASRTGAKPASFSRAGYGGWELAGPETSSFRFASVSPWTVVTWSRNPSARLDRFMQKLKSINPASPAGTNWFEMDWDWTKLPPAWVPAWLACCTPDQSPLASMSISGSGGYLRTRMQLRYPQDFARPIQPWVVPTNIINDPVVSFTAAQAFNPWLAHNEKARSLGLAQLPNQVYVWALSPTPFQTYAACPLPDSSNVLHQLFGKLPGFIRDVFPPIGVGAVRWQTNEGSIIWQGLPFVVPYLYADRGAGSDYLVAGIFPTTLTNMTPLPQELVSQVQHRTNLLLYHWEITSERLAQLQILVPLLRLIDPKEEERLKQFPADPAKRLGLAWSKAIQPLIGNTITEAVVASPRELAIVRKSHIGLNSSELYALSEWLDSSFFGAPTPASTTPNPSSP